MLLDLVKDEARENIYWISEGFTHRVECLSPSLLMLTGQGPSPCPLADGFPTENHSSIQYSFYLALPAS